MFAIYNNVTRGCLINFFVFVFVFCFLFCLFYIYLSLCCCCYFFPSFSPFFHLPTTYLSLVITLLLLLLQLCLLILPLWVFLRSQVGESSKQGIQATWSTPIHQVRWWISRSRGAYKTHAVSEFELFVILAAVCHSELVIGCCESPTCVSSFYHYYCFYYYYYYYHYFYYCYYYYCYYYYFIIIWLLGFLIKNSLLFL